MFRVFTGHERSWFGLLSCDILSQIRENPRIFFRHEPAGFCASNAVV